jgi:hypothetical protein
MFGDGQCFDGGRAECRLRSDFKLQRCRAESSELQHIEFTARSSAWGPPVNLGIILAGANRTLLYSMFCSGGPPPPGSYGYGGFNQMNTSGSITSAATDSYEPPEIVAAAFGADENAWAVYETPSGPHLGDLRACAYQPSGWIQGITSGPDGALWLPSDASSGGALLRATTSCSVTTAATITTPLDDRSIASAGGALWVIDIGANAIDKFTTTGIETSFRVPKTWRADGFGDVGYITSSPDGAYVYFDYTAGSQIGRVNVANGQVEEYTLQSGSGAFMPQMLAADLSGNVWTYQGSVILNVTFPK